MGEIYLATDDVLGREVAVKVLAKRFSLDADLRERFKREALAAARLSGNHNIVTVDVDVEDVAAGGATGFAASSVEARPPRISRQAAIEKRA